MSSTFWINLPVKDMAKAKAFYRAIGLRENPRHAAAPTMGSFFLDDRNTVMMLFPVSEMERYLGGEVSNTTLGNEVLFNFDAKSPADVDVFAERVAAAGGTVYGKPGYAGQGDWMYAFGFVDPDGHRWSVLYMDESKMPQQ